ncbi:hypothetical protein [Flavobacterium araucananum]|uniref:hypothetical protein n=1 Tax=Flavobacterium araucananum TaxID=946678 RepID=UPI00374361EC
MSVLPQRKAFGNKPVFILAASPGSRGGATVLELAKNTMPHFGGNFQKFATLDPIFKGRR